MATTEIHAIETTPEKALNYCLADKIVEIINDDEINTEIPHEIIEDTEHGKRYVRYFTITGYQDCALENPYEAFRERQSKWQGVKYKNDGNKTKSGKEPLMYHMHQSFDGFEVPYEIANEIGRKLAEEVFKGFIVTISTHGNTNNLHNHFIISAWDDDGKKYNDCLSTMREIRRVSDRLCEEYGLSVLEHTRDMKMIHYEDKNGVKRMYEPTDRKNELIKKREKGEISTDDVNSYRNTPKYEETQKIKTDNRTEIKTDIDTVLPSCRSYEELLLRLRELGYIIRDKKKNGDWLAHISFQSPTQDKATREDKIGDGEFYTRDNLTKYIDNQANRLEQEQPLRDDNHGDNKPNKSIPYISYYEYGKTNLNDIDDNYKTVLENGEYQTVERTFTEKKILSDIRIKDSEVSGLIDTTQLHRIIAEQNTQRSQKKPYLSATQEQRLVLQIQNSFRCLQYTEQHHIFSYKQIIDLYSANKGKYDTTIDNFNKAEAAINQLKDILTTPQKLSQLLDKIETSRSDVSYVLEEYNDDKKEVAKYKAIISRYKIETPQGIQALGNKIAEFESKQNVNRGYMENVIIQMSELENCIRTFDRIDTEKGNKNAQAMQEFERVSRPQDNQNREKDKKKGHDER